MGPPFSFGQTINGDRESEFSLSAKISTCANGSTCDFEPVQVASKRWSTSMGALAWFGVVLGVQSKPLNAGLAVAFPVERCLNRAAIEPRMACREPESSHSESPSIGRGPRSWSTRRAKNTNRCMNGAPPFRVFFGFQYSQKCMRAHGLIRSEHAGSELVTPVGELNPDQSSGVTTRLSMVGGEVISRPFYVDVAAFSRIGEHAIERVFSPAEATSAPCRPSPWPTKESGVRF